MAYWVRAICTTEAAPSIRTLLTWLRETDEFPNAAVPNEKAKALDSAKWKSFELVYDPDAPSIQVECNRNTGARSLFVGEVKGELETLAERRDSAAKRRVVKCFQEAKFIVCCTVSNDLDHKESFGVRMVLDFFVEHCGAILHVEDEGYYSRSNKLILGL